MCEIAIKEHKTRGAEVIELLEMLGGKNIYKLTGNDCAYYVIEHSEIRIGEYIFGNEPYRFFTLEEFYEKYPYKVGDKVTFGDIDNIVWEIESLQWEDNEIKYIIRDNNKSRLCDIKAEHLQPYKEETIDKTNKVIFETNVQSCDISNEIIKKDVEEIKIDIPNGYEFFGIDDDNQVVLAKKQPQYPKTYRECSLINGCEDRIPLKIIEEFIKLINARNAYWKIAGEEMSLGNPWEPDWKNLEQEKHCIWVDVGSITLQNGYRCQHILVFPTEQMRDEFYDNFKDLIEQCKELL